MLDHCVHRRAGLDHAEDLAGLLEVVGELLDRVAADDVLAFRASVDEGVNLFDGAVVARHGEALRLHVHDEVLAHHGEPNQANVSFLHLISPLS